MGNFGEFLRAKPPAVTPASPAPSATGQEPVSDSDAETIQSLLVALDRQINGGEGITALAGRLLDPASKVLGAVEAGKRETLALQKALAASRAAYDDVRNKLSELEKDAGAVERERVKLHRDLATAENSRRALEIEAVAHGAQIADLEGRLARESTTLKSLRNEIHVLRERLAVADERVAKLAPLQGENLLLDNALGSIHRAYGELRNEMIAVKRKADAAVREFQLEIANLKARLSQESAATETLRSQSRAFQSEIADRDTRLLQQKTTYEALRDKCQAFEVQLADRDARLSQETTASEALRKKCGELTEQVAAAQQAVRRHEEQKDLAANMLERVKADLSANIADRRAQIEKFEEHLLRETTALNAARDESRRLAGRLGDTDRKNAELAAQLEEARRKIAQLEDDKNLLRVSLNKTIAETIERRVVAVQLKETGRPNLFVVPPAPADFTAGPRRAANR
jgi:chromosome segregation ATPase